MLLQEVDSGFRRKAAQVLNIDRNRLYRQYRQDVIDQPYRDLIIDILNERPFYGYRRVALQLRISRNRARRLMRKFGLFPAPMVAKRRGQAAADDEPADRIPENLLKKLGIQAEHPDHVWACDFTYLYCLGRWHYLATIIDLYSREILGWAIDTTHDAEFVMRALLNALSGYGPPNYLHFDQGSEYLSKTHISFCDLIDITVSASAKGKPWENGFQERFYNTLKNEQGLKAAARSVGSEAELFKEIELAITDYNTGRLHTKIGTTPNQHRQNHAIARENP